MSAPPVHDAPRPLAELLDDVAGFLSRYMYFESDAQLHAVTLWIGSTYVYDAYDVCPYLSISSPEKRAGKTLLLELIELLCRDGMSAANITPAALFRYVDEHHPTLLLDELDAIFFSTRSADQRQQELRGLINAGYRKNGRAVRAKKTGEIEVFSAFCPKVFAGIGQPPDTISDRSIPINLERKPRDVGVERYRARKVAPLGQALRDDLAEATAGLSARLSHHDPRLPSELNDRQQDTWELLFALADEASPEWADATRDAAVAISKAVSTDEASESLGQKLLADLRQVWGEAESAVHSKVLIDRLHGLEESGWAEWYGRGFNQNDLAKILRTYQVHSKDVKIEGTNRKGYRRDDLYRPWKRYVPEEMGATGATSATSPAPIEESAATQSATQPLPPPESDTGSGKVAPEVAPEIARPAREVAEVAPVAPVSKGNWKGLVEDVSPNGSFTEIKLRGRAPLKALKDKLTGDVFAAGDSVTINQDGDSYIVTNTTRGVAS